MKYLGRGSKYHGGPNISLHTAFSSFILGREEKSAIVAYHKLGRTLHSFY